MYVNSAGKPLVFLVALKYMKEHAREEPYVCKHCGKVFMTLHQVQAQGLYHSVESCSVHEHHRKAFTWDISFQRHKQQHSGDNPWMCNHCGKALSSLNSLRIHTL
jgi:KRAB domain-containing zinc finger protein